MISCIVTTYKRSSDILKRALDSIIYQTYKDIEIIVINDAPEMTELSKEISQLVNMYDVPIKYIVHERNMGACAARNTGIENADGEFIAFLDDDDEWLPDKLEIQLEKMLEVNAGLVYCAYYNVDANGKETLKKEETFSKSNVYDEFERLLCYNYIGSTSFPLLRKSAVKDVGCFNTDLRASQDHELWLRIAKKYPIAYCDIPLVRYYYSTEAISRSMINKLQGYEYILDEYWEFYNTDKYIMNYRYNLLAYTCLKNHSLNYFASYWIKAIKVKPLSGNNFLFLKKVMMKIMNLVHFSF